MPTKDHENHPIPGKCFNIHLENNVIINTIVDEILLNETQRVSAVREAPDFWNLIVMITIYIRFRK